MVYDCFAFFNELDLLEIRLNELNEVVDKFVLVEATRTFQKNPKPLYFEEKKERFKPFLDKIIHIVVDKYPNFFAKFRVPNPWDYDNHQKEFILKGLVNCNPDDVIIISDLDEIPNPQKITEYKDKPGIKVFNQGFYSYFVNCIVTQDEAHGKQPIPWLGTVMLNYKDLTTIRKVRTDYRDQEQSKQHTVIEDGGWHFTYLGGIKTIIYKIESLSHPEMNKAKYKDPAQIKKLIESGKDIFKRDNMAHSFLPLDASFPRYIVENQSKFEELIYNV